MTTPNQTADPDASRRRLRLAIVFGVAIVIGLLAWLLLRDGDSNNNESAAGPTAASVTDLQGLPAEVGHPVYWAGPRSRETSTYELSRLANRNIYIRYLPRNTPLGVPRPDYLVVGTYPFRNPLPALRRIARRPDALSKQLKGGGLVVSNSADAQNAYFAYPGEEVQVEVFHPRPGRAYKLVTAGRVVPVS
jgi:hypothetical protein